MHSLKSSSRQFGSPKLGELAEKLETMGKDNEISLADDILLSIIEIHEQVEQRISEEMLNK